MLLNEREVKILEKFYYNSEIKISNLAKSFNITERMVRYNISRINKLLKFIKIKPICKNNKGFYVFENKHPKILELIKELEPIDKNKRINIIKLAISYSNKKRTVEYFAKFFNVSRITINNYIKEINSMIKKNELEIKNENGLSIFGKHENLFEYKIQVLSEFISVLNGESINDYSKIVKSIIFENITLKDYEKIKKFSEEIIKDFNLKINDSNYNLYVSKLIYIYAFKYYYIGLKKEILDSVEYNYVKNKLNLSEVILANIAYITIWLKSYNDFEKDYKDIINIELLSKDMIKKVSSKININILEDKLLNEFLVEHLKSLIYRIKEGYKIKETYISNENRVFDDLYNYILEASNIFSKILNINLDEDEIHLIRLHFLASIERFKFKEQKPKDIIIITDLGAGSKKILIENITSKFLVNIKYIGSKFELSEEISKDYETDIILSTSNLNKEDFLDKNIIKISPILSDENIEYLKTIGLKVRTNKIMLTDLMGIIKKYTVVKNENKLVEDLLKTFNNSILNDKDIINNPKNVIKQENIIFDCEDKSIEKAVRRSLKLLENGYTDKSYTRDVIKILKEKSIYIIRYNGVIIPHTINKNNVYKSGISIISLKTPIKTTDTNEDIDTIVTFAIEDEKNMLDIISNMITKVFTTDFKNILAYKNKNKLIKYLENIGGNYNV
ncbi:BglG family transcription antiterminator [Oceanivirga salmonicida]|uniref:BglG family transcription antiterminator n=1 Tax=Oceanivirga salmonicida TaxID=1769291 RepID=UPI0012E2D819|nr:PRD domain-containing protein [Oceanivirga salmonicida]